MQAGLSAGSVVAKFQADITDLQRGVTQAKASVSSLGTHVSGIGTGIQSFFGKAGQQAQDLSRTLLTVGSVGTVAMGLLGKSAVQVAADLETQRVGFKTLLGTVEAADAAIAMIKKDAQSTPFEFTGLVEANKALTFVTGNAQKSESVLLNVGKALSAAGKGQNELNGVIYNLQQIGNTGKITEMDIRQFGNNGVNILQVLADYYGTTKDKAADMVKESKNAFEDLSAAFEKAGGEGGKYATAFADANGTYNQSISNLIDGWKIAMADIVTGSGAFDKVKEAIAGITQFITDHKQDVIDFINSTVSGIQAIGDSQGFQIFVAVLKSIGEWIVANKDIVIPFLQGLAIALGALLIITGVTAALTAILSPLNLIMIAVALLYTAWTNNWGGIQEKTKIIGEFFIGWMADIKHAWDSWGKDVFETIKSAFMSIFYIFKFIFQLITDTITIFVLFFSGEWGAMWEAIKTGTSHALSNIVGIFGNAWDMIKNGISGVYDYFVTKFTDMWNKAKEIAENIRHSISDAFDKDKHNSPSIADKVNELKNFVESNQFGFTPNIVPQGASTINQTINAEVSNGVDIDMLGNRLAFLMRSTQ